MSRRCWEICRIRVVSVPDKSYHTLDDFEVNGQLILVRADLNVPLDNARQITDDTRIKRLLPTLEELSRRGSRTILISHFGRPEGRRIRDLSLEIVSPYLSKALNGVDIAFANDCIGNVAKSVVNKLKPGEFALLENLRFHKGEEANDSNFAIELAALGAIYINDAFSASHRSHASVVGVPRLLPHAAGRLMQAELEALCKVLDHPQQPAMAIVGGAKISTKLRLLGNLVDHVDILAIGGGMANTLLYAKGVEVGTSICEPEMANEAREILTKATASSCEILLPVDVVTLTDSKLNEEPQIVSIDSVAPQAKILDIGPASTYQIGSRISDCKTLLWNGPMGMFETPPFDNSTNFLAHKTAAMTQTGSLISVAGGGDTLAALSHAGVETEFSYLSTAGGAFLEWLEGNCLPGVTALKP